MARPSRTGGKTSEAKARNATPAKGRKTTKTKRRIAPAASRLKRRSVSGPNEDLREAREQQAATAEILKVIARQTGFADRDRMRRAFLRAFGQPPQVIRRNARADVAA